MNIKNIFHAKDKKEKLIYFNVGKSGKMHTCTLSTCMQKTCNFYTGSVNNNKTPKRIL